LPTSSPQCRSNFALIIKDEQNVDTHLHSEGGNMDLPGLSPAMGNTRRMITNRFMLNAALCLLCTTALPAHAILTGDEWEVLEDVELIENHNNDGDSFRVRWQDTEFTVRIYFVDAPETNLGYRDRVQEQAEYFGITLEQAVEAGNMASEFVLTKLREKGFTITTRWQHVFSGYYPDRIYGFVTVCGRDLGELLVENGLGRIHGQRVWGLTEPIRKRLAEIEEEAKAEGRGAWGDARHR
jgi:endonuclease YncB( thermonuclease family)